MRREVRSGTTLTLLLIAMLTLAFNRAYGEARSENALCVVETTDGGYALAGVTQTFGAGGGDFWLVKTDSAGNMEWSKTYGGVDYEVAHSVVETSDGGYALAGFTGPYPNWDFWLVKVDSSGNVQWSKTYGGDNRDAAYCVVETSDGGYALAGTTAPFFEGPQDFWLVKTDSAGNMLWNRTYGGVGYEIAQSVVQTADGGYALAGVTESFGAGGEDFWLVKTDASGNTQWNRTCGGANDDIARSLVQTSDGGYALAGRTFSLGTGGDFWLIKVDSSGNHEWNRTYGGVDYEVAHSVIETGDGGYALAGVTESLEAMDEATLLKVDSSGNMEWTKTYGADNWDEIRCVVETSDGGYALAGTTASFGADREDFWLIKVDSSGNMEWHKKYGGVYYGEWILYAGLASSVVIVGVVIAIYVKRIKT